VLLVGCEAAQLDEGIGLSDTVAAAVPVAVSVVRELVASRIDAGDIASRIDAGDIASRIDAGDKETG